MPDREHMMAAGTFFGRHVARAASFIAISLASCTTYVRPVACEGGEYQCNEHKDVIFCEYVAVAVAGADCEAIGIAPSKPFCIVAPTQKCVGTTFAVQGRDCRVQHQRAVREWRTCSPGAPSFVGE